MKNIFVIILFALLSLSLYISVYAAGLNKDERKVRDKLKEALNISEDFISKEIKDVEKELE